MAAVATLTPAERWRLAAHRAGTHSLLVWPPVAVAVLVIAKVLKGSLEIDLARAYLAAAHAAVRLLPLPLWVGPQGSANGRPSQTALVLCLVAFVFVVARFASSRA